MGYIGPEGAKAIAKALEKNTTITSINLQCNEIGYQGAIAAALKKNTTLSSIDLSDNRIVLSKEIYSSFQLL